MDCCTRQRPFDQLGLDQFTKRPVRTAAGPIEVSIYGTVRLTVQGRAFNGDVAEVSDDCPALLGRVPLEVLDFIIDPVGQKLIGNPAHGGVQMMEIYPAYTNTGI